MKNTLSLLAGAALVTVIAFAASASPSPAATVVASVPAIDDPPPEPLDCPLCGGNPALHARKMLDLGALTGHVLSYALRW